MQQVQDENRDYGFFNSEDDDDDDDDDDSARCSVTCNSNE